MVAMPQFHGQSPRFIRHLLHWVGSGIPVIEITHQADRLSVWGIADEIHRPHRLLAAVTIQVHNAPLTPAGFAGFETPFAGLAPIGRQASGTHRSSRTWIDADAAIKF